MSQYHSTPQTHIQWLSIAEVSSLTGLSSAVVNQRLYDAPNQALRYQIDNSREIMHIHRSYIIDCFALEIETNKIPFVPTTNNSLLLSVDFLHFVSWYRTSIRQQQVKVQKQIEELHRMVIQLQKEIARLSEKLFDIHNTLRTNNDFTDRLLDDINSKEIYVTTLNQRIQNLQHLNTQKGNMQSAMLSFIKKIAPQLPNLPQGYSNLSTDEQEQIALGLYDNLFGEIMPKVNSSE